MTVDDSYDCRDVVEGVLGHMRRERIYPGREPTARVEREHTRGASQSCASREYISTPFFSVSKRFQKFPGEFNVTLDQALETDVGRAAVHLREANVAAEGRSEERNEGERELKELREELARLEAARKEELARLEAARKEELARLEVARKEELDASQTQVRDSQTNPFVTNVIRVRYNVELKD
eukprot:1194811-Prorocentrum_minimum.AAC.4